MKLFATFIVAVILEIPDCVFAQGWTNANVPDAFWFSVSASAGGRKLVAVNNSGIAYQSTNSGADWFATSASFPNIFAGNAVASSADGRVLVSGEATNIPNAGRIFVSTNSGASWSMANVPTEQWTGIATSADGKRIVAVAGGKSPGPVYVSMNSGSTWSNSGAPVTNWSSVASSADGSKFIAVAGLYAVGSVYISTNSGTNWNAIVGTAKNWSSIACSADGNKLVGADRNSRYIYVSTNSGTTWFTSGAPYALWTSVASSADGSILAGTIYQGPICSSTNSGINWTTNVLPNAMWTSIASSADGSKLFAAVDGGGIYTFQAGTQNKPVMSMSKSGTNMVLSWSFYAADYGLQQCQNLFAPNWTDITNTFPAITNLQCRITLPKTIGAVFYRLKAY